MGGCFSAKKKPVKVIKADVGTGLNRSKHHPEDDEDDFSSVHTLKASGEIHQDKSQVGEHSSQSA